MNKYQNEMVIRKLNAFALMYGLITLLAGKYWDIINTSLSIEKFFFLIVLSILLLVSLFMLMLKYLLKGLYRESSAKEMMYLGVFIIANVVLSVPSILVWHDNGIQNMPSMYSRILIACFINLLMNISSIFYIWSLRRKSVP